MLDLLFILIGSTSQSGGIPYHHNTAVTPYLENTNRQLNGLSNTRKMKVKIDSDALSVS